MTGDHVQRILDGVERFFAPVAPGRIKLDHNFPRGCGVTVEQPDVGIMFYVGCAGLAGNLSELSDYDAMTAIIGFFHEVCGHGGQLKFEFNKKTNLSRILALNHYACKSSGLYYDGRAAPGEITKQYLRQPHEIAAEYMGLRAAQSYLPRVLGSKPGDSKDRVGHARTDELLLAYANGRIKTGKWFVQTSREFKNVGEIFRELNRCFMECYHDHREYSYSDDYEVFEDGSSAYSPIPAQVLLNKQVPEYGLTPAQATYAERCAYGVHQDLMVCAAAREQWDEYAAFLDKPALQGISWRYEHAFVWTLPICLPHSGLRPMERMTNMTKYADRIRKRDGPGTNSGPSGPGE